MDKYIANSTAANPLGIPTGRKCLKVSSGPYANRLAIVYASSASNIVLVWADAPYSDFSSPTVIISDSGDHPFDAYMDDEGNIYAVYTIDSSFNLGFIKLTFANGEWTAGSPVTVYNTDNNYNPSIAKFSTGDLGIVFARDSGESYYMNFKSSSDDGATWGTVSDPGDVLISGSGSIFGRILESQDYIYAFYTYGGTKAAYRRRAISGSTWESEITLASGSGFDENICAAENPDGRIGLAYANSLGLAYREYSGSSWGGEQLIYADTAYSPTVAFYGGIPFIIFYFNVGNGMDLVYYTKKENESFSVPAILDSRKSLFQSFLVYDESAGSIQDKTNEASSSAAADIYHSGTNGMLAASGDSIFFGMERPIHFINLNLSTAGIGGEVIWRYFDGQTWKTFTPFSGSWHFTTTSHDLLLWADANSVPVDWQKNSIDGNSLYWVAATVANAYTTNPIGSQITAAPDINGLSVRG